MSLYSDLNEVLTPYAQKIKGLVVEKDNLKTELSEVNNIGIGAIALGVSIESTGEYYPADYADTKIKTASSVWGVTNLIDVSGVSYIRYLGLGDVGQTPYGVFFDSNGEPISTFKPKNQTGILEIPSGVKYVSFSVKSNSYSTIKVYKLDDVEPMRKTITNAVYNTVDKYVKPNVDTIVSVYDLSAGTYVLETNAVAQSISDLPVTLAGVIRVYQTIQTSRKMILFIPANELDIYFTERIASGGVHWSQWKKLSGKYVGAIQVSNAVSAGEYFEENSDLYVALTDLSANTVLEEGVNCERVSLSTLATTAVTLRDITITTELQKLHVSVGTDGVYYPSNYASTKTTKSAQSWRITNLIDVSGYSMIQYSGLTDVGIAPYSAWFDSDGVAISTFKQAVGLNKLAVPSGAKYLSFSVNVKEASQLAVDGCVMGDVRTAVEGALSTKRRVIAMDDIVFTVGYSYVRRIDNTLYLSSDGGRTYPRSIEMPSGFGVLRHIYLFRTNTLLICDHTNAYYTDDWTTWTESTCLDADGTAYVPTSYDTFTTLVRPRRTIIDGNEILVWGTYNITDNDNNRVLIWYTVDNGHTLKVAYEFNIEGHYYIRHVHSVSYCEEQKNFWICTGDSMTIQPDGYAENKLIKGVYDFVNDSWTFTVAASYARSYKWAGLAFFEGYCYYALDVTPGKIKRCKIGEEADLSKHEVLYEGLPNDVVGLHMGKTSGEMVVTLSIYRSGDTTSKADQYDDAKHIFYSSDRVNFVEIVGTYPSDKVPYQAVYNMFCEPNADGKILCGCEDSNDGFDKKDGLPSVFLDDIIRNAGFDCNFK